MSKIEILAELPCLKPEERQSLIERLCELEEDDLLQGHGPAPQERRLLDVAFAEFERDGNPGQPWREVLQALRASAIS